MPRIWRIDLAQLVGLPTSGIGAKGLLTILSPVDFP